MSENNHPLPSSPALLPEGEGRQQPAVSPSAAAGRSGTALVNIRTIMKRELAGYFTSPIAYVFLVIFLLLTGFFTFTIGNFFERGEASLVSFFTWHPWLYCGRRSGGWARWNCC